MQHHVVPQADTGHSEISPRFGAAPSRFNKNHAHTTTFRGGGLLHGPTSMHRLRDPAACRCPLAVPLLASQHQEAAISLSPRRSFPRKDMLQGKSQPLFKGHNCKPHVVTDGNLVRGPNPASAHTGANSLLEQVRIPALALITSITRNWMDHSIRPPVQAPRRHLAAVYTSAIYARNPAASIAHTTLAANAVLAAPPPLGHALLTSSLSPPPPGLHHAGDDRCR